MVYRLKKVKLDLSKINNKDITFDKLTSAIKTVHKTDPTITTEEQSHPFLYLYGAMAQSHLINLVRGQCILEDVKGLEEILVNWRNATNLFRQIELKEHGRADKNFPMDIESNSKLKQIAENPLFKNTFSQSPIEFKLVNVDNLVAPQRNVSLEYVDQIMKRIPQNPSIDDLIDLCISPKQAVPPIKTLQQAQNLCTFSSPSIDFRFLGGFLKENLTDEDLKYCLDGGNPVCAMILFVGYGGGSINVLQANNRLILNNGFHRVYALRKKGINKIPVVVQKIGNPELEFPQNILGLSRAYLLNHKRPVLVKDFFEEGMTTTLRLKHAVRSVQVQWGTNQLNMAV